MNDAFSSFLLGLLCTGGLFLLCVILAVGARIIFLSVRERFFKNKPLEDISPSKEPKPKRKRKSQPKAKPVRSIEIDPEQVDKIYVKKIS